jgi:hypothetical protein
MLEVFGPVPDRGMVPFDTEKVLVWLHKTQETQNGCRVADSEDEILGRTVFLGQF